MLHHISIPVENPLHVAEVLAEILNGKVAPFPPNADSYLVVQGDAYGTMIEFYPVGTELIPGYAANPVSFAQNAFASPFTAVHAAISVPASPEQIAEIGDREGWRTVCCNRGPFQVIEFWLENKLMLELLPATFAAQYMEAMQPHNLERLFAEAEAKASGTPVAV